MSTAPRSALSLAALATVAVPGLEPVATKPVVSSNSFDVATVIDSRDRRWGVRAPRSAIAGAAMEGELALLGHLARLIDDAGLPFNVPRPAGFANLIEGGRAMVYPEIMGQPLKIDLITKALAGEVARAIAALHNIGIAAIADTVPTYSADEYRARRLTEIDEAAATGHIPPELLQRWEEALEDVRLWRFTPTLVHGELAAEHILIRQGTVVGFIEWANARVADPAEDLSFVLAAAPVETIDTFIDSYTAARGVQDDYLLARSTLTSELAIVRWLMHGVRENDQDIIDDAAGMLAELTAATAGADPIPVVGIDEPHTQDAPADDEATSDGMADDEHSSSHAPVGSSAVELPGEPASSSDSHPRDTDEDDAPTIEIPREQLGFDTHHDRSDPLEP